MWNSQSDTDEFKSESNIKYIDDVCAKLRDTKFVVLS